ncbi:MAG: SGNH/GDSL hydrolase family protein, partial [Planctomycetaceae bacterium]
FSLMLLEAGLRVTGFEFPVTTTRHVHRGYSNRPDAVWIQRSEGYATVRTNSRGFRDVEWAAEKPPGTVRIAVLGDSFTEASQVPAEHRFTELAAHHLRQTEACAGSQIEVMNFGTSGYGTAQQLMTWRHEVKAFKPDYVVLAFLTGNDVRNNSEQLEGDPVRPYFIEQNGELVLDDSFRDERLSLARSAGLTAAGYSRVAQVAYQVFRGIRARRKLEQIRQASPAEAELVELGLAEPGLSTWIYASPVKKEHQAAWRITEKLLTQLHYEVSQAGAKFLVVSLTNSIQVHPSQDSRRKFTTVLRLDDILYPDRRVEEVCRRNRIPVLTLAPRMQAHAQEQHEFLHGFSNTTPGQGHWNSAGHRVAGRLIGGWLEREIVQPADSVQPVSHEE